MRRTFIALAALVLSSLASLPAQAADLDDLLDYDTSWSSSDYIYDCGGYDNTV